MSMNLSKLTVTLADYIQIHIHIRTDEAREQNRPLYKLFFSVTRRSRSDESHLLTY